MLAVIIKSSKEIDLLKSNRMGIQQYKQFRIEWAKSHTELLQITICISPSLKNWQTLLSALSYKI